MTVPESSEHYIQENFKPGDIVYAFAVHVNTAQNGRRQFHKPVKGEFCTTKTAKAETLSRSANDPEINWFVPYDENGRRVFAHAVDINKREYATTEHEARAVYNLRIEEITNWLRQQATVITWQALPRVDTEMPTPTAIEDEFEIFDTTDYVTFREHVLPFLKLRRWTEADKDMSHMRVKRQVVENAWVINKNGQNICAIHVNLCKNRIFRIPEAALLGFPGTYLYIAQPD